MDTLHVEIVQIIELKDYLLELYLSCFRISVGSSEIIELLNTL